jgi:hypothetical protein
MTSFINGPIGQFLIGGTIVALISYIANSLDNPKLASIITAFPIGLVPIYFMWKHRKVKEYSTDTTYTNFIVVLTYLVFDFLIRHYKGMSIEDITSLSFLAWIIICIVAYIIVLA